MQHVEHFPSTGASLKVANALCPSGLASLKTTHHVCVKQLRLGEKNKQIRSDSVSFSDVKFDMAGKSETMKARS